MKEIMIKKNIRDCRDCQNVEWERSNKGLYYNCYCVENKERRLVEEDCLGIGDKAPTIPKWCPYVNNK